MTFIFTSKILIHSKVNSNKQLKKQIKKDLKKGKTFMCPSHSPTTFNPKLNNAALFRGKKTHAGKNTLTIQ